MICREVAVFLVVGSLTVVLDFSIYRGLAWLDLTGTELAKAISFLMGTLFAFSANRIWTFGQTKHALGSGWRFALLYSFTLATNVAVNALALIMMDGILMSIQWAFLLATGVSAILNFLGMKFFVFKASPISARL